MSNHSSAKSPLCRLLPNVAAMGMACSLGMWAVAPRAFARQSGEAPSIGQPADPSTAMPDAVPTIHELLQVYRDRPFAEKCEVIVKRERTGQPSSERKATAIVRCDPRVESQRLRLDLGDLAVFTDSSQAVCVSSKDDKSFYSTPRRATVLATLSELVPPLPFVNVLLAFDAGLPDRMEALAGLSWSTEIRGDSVVFAANAITTSIQLTCGGTPLRLLESRTRRGSASDTLETRIIYTPAVFSERDLTIDLTGREARRSLAELNLGAGDSSAPAGRVPNIHGNTADFKPWSLADAVAARRAASDTPLVVAVLMFKGPLGIDSRTITPEVNVALSGLRDASIELRRAATDPPTGTQVMPRLAIEPLAVYDLATFERDAPAKLGAAWSAANASQSDAASLRWCLSPATTLEKYAKGSSQCILLFDGDMNFVASITPGADAAQVRTQIIQAIRTK